MYVLVPYMPWWSKYMYTNKFIHSSCHNLSLYIYIHTVYISNDDFGWDDRPLFNRIWAHCPLASPLTKLKNLSIFAPPVLLSFIFYHKIFSCKHQRFDGNAIDLIPPPVTAFDSFFCCSPLHQEAYVKAKQWSSTISFSACVALTTVIRIPPQLSRAKEAVPTLYILPPETRWSQLFPIGFRCSIFKLTRSELFILRLDQTYGASLSPPMMHYCSWLTYKTMPC